MPEFTRMGISILTSFGIPGKGTLKCKIYYVTHFSKKHFQHHVRHADARLVG